MIYFGVFVMHDLPSYQEAELYFQNLWAKAETSLSTGDISPAEMKDGRTVPINYCVSTVARVITQPQSPLEKVQKLMEKLKSSLPNQFFYNETSLHISLIGCTPRLPTKEDFPSDQLEKLGMICKDTLSGQGEVQLYLKGIGLIGNQIFVQVFPLDHKWAFFRQTLEENLLKGGEQPISYPNKAPIHLNIMRITDITDGTLQQLEKLLRLLKDVDLGIFTIMNIDFLITDFVLADISVLANINLE